MTEKVCVHLPTQEQRDTYMQWAEKKGWKWRGRAPALDPDSASWQEFRGATTVNYGENIMYCSRSWYEKNGYRILTLEEAMREKVEEEQRYLENSCSSSEFVRGEEVEVKPMDGGWRKAIYYDTIIGEASPYIAKSSGTDFYIGRFDIRKL